MQVVVVASGPISRQNVVVVIGSIGGQIVVAVGRWTLNRGSWAWRRRRKIVVIVVGSIVIGPVVVGRSIVTRPVVVSRSIVTGPVVVGRGIVTWPIARSVGWWRTITISTTSSRSSRWRGTITASTSIGPRVTICNFIQWRIDWVEGYIRNFRIIFDMDLHNRVAFRGTYYETPWTPQFTSG